MVDISLMEISTRQNLVNLIGFSVGFTEVGQECQRHRELTSGTLQLLSI